MRLQTGTTTMITEIRRIKSLIKKLYSYLLTKKIRHKHYVKVCSFSGAKTNCMTNHVKPTLKEIQQISSHNELFKSNYYND